MRKKLFTQNGVDYYDEVPKDYVPEKRAHFERGKWSSSRQADYAYYESKIQDLPQKSVCVDLGCGIGLYRELFEKFDYIGVDMYPFKGVSVVADIGKELPLKTESADIVVISNVLEHVKDPEVLLNECHRVLKRGGLLLGSVPFLAHEHQVPYDFYRYTSYMLSELFSRAGFCSSTVVPLEKPADVYYWWQTRFFSLLLRQKLSMWKRLQARLARKITRITFRVFSAVFAKVGTTTEFCRRYGFTAIK